MSFGLNSLRQIIHFPCKKMGNAKNILSWTNIEKRVGSRTIFLVVFISWGFVFPKLLCLHGYCYPELEITYWAQSHGYFFALLLVALRISMLACFPIYLLTLWGLIRYDCWPKHVPLQVRPEEVPFLIVRVVTRGSYPDLVFDSVSKNLQTLKSVGCTNFLIQVVTEVQLRLPVSTHVCQVILPRNYRCKSGALYKARALQYCLEEKIDTFNKEDWICHLDEESLLTEDSVRGIMNFIASGAHCFGQGMITFANIPTTFKQFSQRVQHHLCLIGDCFRVADDQGKYKAQFKTFNKSLVGIKGSYVVAKVSAERDVTFDQYPEGSIAEDAYFSLRAVEKGYSFEFIEGPVHENSTFTIVDYYKQRRRWIQGIHLTCLSSRISLRVKWVLCYVQLLHCILPFVIMANLVIVTFSPVRMGPTYDFILYSLSAIFWFMYAFGYALQFPLARYSLLRFLLVIPELVLGVCTIFMVDMAVPLTFWFGTWKGFHVVKKEREELTSFVDIA